MRSIIVLFIATLIWGICINCKANADVWVMTEKYHKPLILTEKQWKEAVGKSEVKEITANNFHFEIVQINGKRYLHYFDIDEKTYWNVIVSKGS